MDGNYDIRAIAVSLKTRCAVKVVQQVLLASRIHRMEPDVEELAKRLVRELELPRELIEMLENLIRPMKVEMTDWYEEFGQCGDPILTPVGSVDRLRSVDALLLNEKMDKMTRFKMACYNCSENHISELFEELTAKELNSVNAEDSLRGQTSFPYFWKRVLLGHFGSLSPDGHLPQAACDEGFVLALRTSNDVAIRHFINKASPEVVYSRSNCSSFIPDIFVSPATLCLLFSKLNMAVQRHFIHYLAFSVLFSLSYFPYQSFFVNAAHALTRHLTKDCYWSLVSLLFPAISGNAKDFNYHTLFHQFWLEGSCHRHGPMTYHFIPIIVKIVKFQDVPLINFVLAETSIEWKEALLMDSRIYAALISFKEFKLLELFIRSCGVCNRDVLLAFKLRFTAFVEDFNGTGRDWGADLSRFANVMDEIIAKKPESEKITQ